MVIIEGKGMVAPPPYRYKLTSLELSYLERLAADRKRHRGYSQFRSTWKSGVISDAVLVGMVGEFCVCQVLRKNNVRVESDLDVLNAGDDGIDLIAADVTYQVKTRISKRNRFIRRVDDKGRLQKIAAERFVFCSFDSRDVCEIDGWCSSDTVLKSKFSRSPRGGWFNVNISDASLGSFRDLLLQIGMESMNYG